MSLPTVPTKFAGWIGKDKAAVGNLVHGEYEPKAFEETDVDIAITHCGVCASDLHTLRSGWGATKYPQVVGHEIVGIAVRVGKDVKHIKVGDRIGVGAQSGSCLKCSECSSEREPYCLNGMVGTYNGIYPSGDKSSGGYADFARLPAHFAIQIPDGLPSAVAAPMLCGGVTVFSPLKQYGAGTERKEVGIAGIGGLGHFAIMLAKAMGANVTAISHSHNKQADAEKMGAANFIAISDEGAFEKNRSKLDLIISTTNDPKMPLDGYLSLLKPHGYLIFVGLPESALPTFSAGQLIMRNVHIGGSLIGAPSNIYEMLELAASANVKTWVQEWPMEKVNEALIAMQDGKPRYRYVLVNEKHSHLKQQ